jgi:hypothetical protein
MKPRFTIVLDQLKADVVAPRYARLFEGARARSELLRSYADARAVLRAMNGVEAESYPERDALTRALIAQRRVTGEPFWASLLYAAYSPMLTFLRGRITSPRVTSDDADQRVLTSFLFEVDHVSLNHAGHYPVRLRRRTARRVFCRFWEEEGRPVPGGMLVYWDDEEHFSKELTPDESYDQREAASVLLEKLVRAGEEYLEPLVIDAVVSQALTDDGLRTFVERLADVPEAQRPQLYQRVKRAHARALRELREGLPLSPDLRARAMGRRPS